jgi:hypothetical protein
MMSEKEIRQKLEFLKNHMYEELNALKRKILQQNMLKETEINVECYKPTRHKKSNKRINRRFEYRKYIR